MSIPENVIVAWYTTASLPSGWTRVTDMDDRFPKGTTGSPAPDATGGSATHVHDSEGHTHSGNHTHSSNTGNSTGEGRCPALCNVAMLLPTHSHSFTAPSPSGFDSGSTDHGNWAAGSSNPAYYTVRWIKCGDGAPAGLPDDCLAWYNDTSAPTGWGQHAASKAKFFIGASDSANGGGTGGGGTHTHATAAHTHTAGNHTHGSVGTSYLTTGTGTVVSEAYGGNAARSDASSQHAHTADSFPDSGSVTSGGLSSGTSGATTYVPEYHTLVAVENTSGGVSLPEGIIVGWLGAINDIPDEWVLCDGNNDTPNLNGKFIINADNTSELGDTGGSAGHQNSSGGHTHSAAHTHTGGSTNNATVWGLGSTGFITSNNTPYAHKNTTHDHPDTTSGSGGALASTSPTLSNTADTQPAFRTMAFLQYQPESSGSALAFGHDF